MSEETPNNWSDESYDKKPDTREESHFDSDEEDTLFDAYQMLRSFGLSEDELADVAEAIEMSTVYDTETLEEYYENHVEELE